MSKSRFGKMTKADLIRFIERSESIQAAESRATYRIGSKKCIAVPLSHAENQIVADYASRMTSELVCEGKIIDNGSWATECVADLVAEWSYRLDAPLLPQYAGLLIRHHYSKENGTSVIHVWGLLSL